MSAFIVPELTMHHVVTAILASRNQFAGIATFTEDRSHEAMRWPVYYDSGITRGDNGAMTREAADQIGRKLYAMECRGCRAAVSGRVGIRW